MVINQVGGAEVFELAELPVPQPRAGEVLIKLAYAGVIPADWKVREGHLSAFMTYNFPFVLGFDGAGVVAKAGEGVDSFQPGDRAITCSGHSQGTMGTYAEYVLASTTSVAHLPETVGFAEGATVPVAGVTAWQAVGIRADIRTGQRVLVHGGSGAVGSYAIQFAKNRGAEVAATCSAEKQSYVQGLGADLVIDYKSENIQETISTWTTSGLEAVIDTVGCGTLPNAFDLLARGGVLVSVATLVGDGDVEADTALATERGLTKVLASMNAESADRDMTDILALIESKRVRTSPLQELPLEQAGQAQTLVKDGKVFGKMLLHIADFDA